MNDIEARLAALEKASRRWKYLAIGLLGCCVMGIFAGAGAEEIVQFKTVEAQSFHLIDANGKKQGSLYCDPKGEYTGISLGEVDKGHVTIDARKDYAMIRVVGANMGDNVAIYSSENGGSLNVRKNIGNNQDKWVGGIGPK